MKKHNLLWKNCKKLIFHDFCFQFQWDFFFVTQIFRKILYTPPNFFFIHVFYRWQRKIAWKLDTPNLITHRMTSDRMTVVLIPPTPLDWLGLRPMWAHPVFTAKCAREHLGTPSIYCRMCPRTLGHTHLNHYFDRHVCPSSVSPCIRASQKFFFA